MTTVAPKRSDGSLIDIIFKDALKFETKIRSEVCTPQIIVTYTALMLLLKRRRIVLE